MNLGRLLNTVDRPAVECPGCDLREPMEVFLLGVRWRCGHVRELPPIGQKLGPKPASGKY